MSKQRRWTEGETGRLMTLLDEGKTHKEIAGILGRGVGSIYARISLVRQKEAERPEGLLIKDLKDRFHVGGKIKIAHNTGNKKKKTEKGVIIQKYNHHALVKFKNGKESYRYYDLLEAEKC